MSTVTTAFSGLNAGTIATWSGSSSVLLKTVAAMPVCGMNNDSRKIGKGEIFVALTTDKDDGHCYVAAALKQGAVAALVARSKVKNITGIDSNRLIVVNDPIAALRRIATAYRAQLDMPFIGITGSSGKTTARNFIAQVLRQKMQIGETIGNLNNHLGVPFSLLRFTGKEDVGIIEMGANHTREIHALSSIVRPTIGIITNIGYAHIGYFGSLKNIADAKMEIVDGMKDPNGFIMLNGDDRLLVKKAARLKQDVVFFGFSKQCHIRAVNDRLTADKRMCFEVNGVEYGLAMPGRHFIYSALPALFLGRYFGIGESAIIKSLAAMQPVAMRGTIEKKSGATFIVDCYNANPSSMKSALRLLQDVAGKLPSIAIVGDMLELGTYARRLHRALGQQLAHAGVARVIAVGEYASLIADGAVAAGMRANAITIALNSAEALTYAKKIVKPGSVVLLKGSRGVHLETVYEGF